MPTLSLSNIINVIVNLSPAAVLSNSLNVGLIMGSSTIISAATRTAEYSSLADMLSKGWQGTEPEYLAAQFYFNQQPTPKKVVIGRWDKTGAETAVQALTACRASNQNWYAAFLCNAVKADIVAMAPFIETASPASILFFNTSDADVLAGTAGNVFDTLKNAKYTRTIGQYSTTSPYAAASIMGYAMGANTNAANSAYTLAYKAEIGVTPEGLTDAQASAIKSFNGNIYVNRGNAYSIFERGVMVNGTPFDTIINVDKLTGQIQNAIMDLLTSYPKVPQTEDGVTMLNNAIVGPLENALNTGFIAPGVWTGPAILKLETGDALTKGYAVQHDPLSAQSAADRANRLAPTTYICIKLAGAIESVVITLNVNS